MAAQADEVDGRYLHFDNCVQITSSFLAAVFDASKVTKQPPILSSVRTLENALKTFSVCNV